MMWNNYGYNKNYYINNYKESAFKHISELVEEGIKVVNSDVNNEFMKTWLDYSQKIVELSTKELDSSIHLNYLRLLLSIQSNYNMPSNQRIRLCLEYLLEVLRVIKDNY